jgi:hypothetical protein
MATLLSKRGQPRCHGPGASPRSACLGSAPLAAIARGESFAPTQSARTSPVAARDDCRLELPASWRSHPGPRARARLTWTAVAIPRLPGASACAEPPGTGPPPAFPREGERVPPRPRCLPSPDNPCRGSPRPPQAVPSLGSNTADASSILELPRAFDEASGSKKTRSCLSATNFKSRAHH